LVLWNFERREVGSHDVQFDILFCGVCHSDLHQIKDDCGGGIFPMVPGHEIVGEVIKPRILIRLLNEAELFNKSKSSWTIFEDVILLYFEFKNGSKFLVLKKNSDAVDF
jgi:hypothetical protein